jgi:hypothetical protein
MAMFICAAGCSAGTGRQDAVIGGNRTSPVGDFVKGSVATGGIYDIELSGMHNFTGNPVRLTSARLTSPHSAAIRVLNVRAYLLDQTGAAYVDELYDPTVCGKKATNTPPPSGGTSR